MIEENETRMKMNESERRNNEENVNIFKKAKRKNGRYIKKKRIKLKERWNNERKKE